MATVINIERSSSKNDILDDGAGGDTGDGKKSPHKKMKNLSNARIQRPCNQMENMKASSRAIVDSLKKNNSLRNNVINPINNMMYSKGSQQHDHSKKDENFLWSTRFGTIKNKSPIIVSPIRWRKYPNKSTVNQQQQNNKKTSELAVRTSRHMHKNARNFLELQNPLRDLIIKLKTELHSPKRDEKNIKNILLEIQNNIEKVDVTNSVEKPIETFVNAPKDRYNNISVEGIVENPIQLEIPIIECCEETTEFKQEEIGTNDNNSGSQTDEYLNESEPQGTDNTSNCDLNKLPQIKRSNSANLMADLKQYSHYENLAAKYSLLEHVCVSLQIEKSKIKDELNRSQGDILMLKSQISHLEEGLSELIMKGKYDKRNCRTNCLSLKNEINVLRDSMASFKNQQTAEPLIENPTEKLKKIMARIASLEKSRQKNEKITALMKLENEKLMLMGKYREQQINLMQTSMDDIHRYIRTELKDLQEFICNRRSNQFINNLKLNKKREKQTEILTDSKQIQSFPIKKMHRYAKNLTKMSTTSIKKLIQISSNLQVLDNSLKTTGNCETSVNDKLKTENDPLTQTVNKVDLISNYKNEIQKLPQSKRKRKNFIAMNNVDSLTKEMQLLGSALNSNNRMMNENLSDRNKMQIPFVPLRQMLPLSVNEKYYHEEHHRQTNNPYDIPKRNLINMNLKKLPVDEFNQTDYHPISPNHRQNPNSIQNPNYCQQDFEDFSQYNSKAIDPATSKNYTENMTVLKDDNLTSLVYHSSSSSSSNSNTDEMIVHSEQKRANNTNGNKNIAFSSRVRDGLEEKQQFVLPEYNQLETSEDNKFQSKSHSQYHEGKCNDNVLQPSEIDVQNKNRINATFGDLQTQTSSTESMAEFGTILDEIAAESCTLNQQITEMLDCNKFAESDCAAVDSDSTIY